MGKKGLLTEIMTGDVTFYSSFTYGLIFNTLYVILHHFIHGNVFILYISTFYL